MQKKQKTTVAFQTASSNVRFDRFSLEKQLCWQNISDIISSIPYTLFFFDNKIIKLFKQIDNL